MTDYQKANRPDLAILDALSKQIDPVTLATLYGLACPQEKWITGLGEHVSDLVRDGYVTVSGLPRGGIVPLYAITVKGRAHLIAFDTQSIVQEFAPKEYEPAIAMLCVNEDELDAWWKALDVEAKADAFMQWSLGNDGSNSHLYIDPHETVSVPFLGTAGETAEEWKAKAERLNSVHGGDQVAVHMHMSAMDDQSATAFFHKHAALIRRLLQDQLNKNPGHGEQQ